MSSLENQKRTGFQPLLLVSIPTEILLLQQNGARGGAPMKSTLNFTGRKIIRRRDISIRLDTQKSLPGFFAEFSLAEYCLPEDSPVFVEAYSGTKLERYHCGTVASLETGPFILKSFTRGESMRFAVKISDTKIRRGRLLASARSIKPVVPEESEKTQRSLLPVEVEDLGSQAYLLSFNPDPVLKINALLVEAAGDRYAAAHSAEFHALVFPQVLKEVLWYVLSGFEEVPALDDEEEWSNRWIQYARTRLGCEWPPLIPFEETKHMTSEEYSEWYRAVQDWINDAVRRFGDRINGFGKYIKTLKEGAR